MTEYRPRQPEQQTAPNVQSERFVFIDPADRHNRRFEIPAQGPTAIAADSPEVNQAVEDAYRVVEGERDAAAAQTPEASMTPEALRSAMAAQGTWLVRVGRQGELDPESLDESLR